MIRFNGCRRWRCAPLLRFSQSSASAPRRRRRRSRRRRSWKSRKASVARVAPRRWVPGSVVSRNDARLATSAAGRLEYVAEVGTRVRAGERVAKLEDEAVRLRVEDAKAEVARIECAARDVGAPAAAPGESWRNNASRRRSSTKCDRSWPCSRPSCSRRRCASASPSTISIRPNCARRLREWSPNVSHSAASTSRPALRSRTWSTQCISKRACRRRWLWSGSSGRTWSCRSRWRTGR